MSRDPRPAFHLHHLWYNEIVHLYSERDLTSHSDQLPALSNVARVSPEYSAQQLHGWNGDQTSHGVFGEEQQSANQVEQGEVYLKMDSGHRLGVRRQ